MRTQAAEERLGSGREGGGLPKRVIRAREPTESLRGRTATAQQCVLPGVRHLGVREVGQGRLDLRWLRVRLTLPPSAQLPGRSGWVGWRSLPGPRGLAARVSVAPMGERILLAGRVLVR